MAFVQRLVQDFSIEPCVGYMLEANGDWADGLYGCIRIWGNKLNVTSTEWDQVDSLVVLPSEW